MAYILSQKSLKKLEGLNPRLVDVIKSAIQVSNTDFTIVQGLRTIAEQKVNVASGASQTMYSKHLTGNAADVAAWIRGKIDYAEGHELDVYGTIAEAFHRAAVDLDIPLIWGSAWKRNLIEWPSARVAYEDYIAERKRIGKKPFLDWGHFELV